MDSRPEQGHTCCTHPGWPQHSPCPCSDISVLLISADHSCWAALGCSSSVIQHLSPVGTYDGTLFLHLRSTEENVATDQAGVQRPINPEKRKLQETPLLRSKWPSPMRSQQSSSLSVRGRPWIPGEVHFSVGQGMGIWYSGKWLPCSLDTAKALTVSHQNTYCGCRDGLGDRQGSLTCPQGKAETGVSVS